MSKLSEINKAFDIIAEDQSFDDSEIRHLSAAWTALNNLNSGMSNLIRDIDTNKNRTPEEIAAQVKGDAEPEQPDHPIDLRQMKKMASTLNKILKGFGSSWGLIHKNVTSFEGEIVELPDRKIDFGQKLGKTGLNKWVDTLNTIYNQIFRAPYIDEFIEQGRDADNKRLQQFSKHLTQLKDFFDNLQRRGLL
jgi:hypothetical protein